MEVHVDETCWLDIVHITLIIKLLYKLYTRLILMCMLHLNFFNLPWIYLSVYNITPCLQIVRRKGMQSPLFSTWISGLLDNMKVTKKFWIDKTCVTPLPPPFTILDSLMTHVDKEGRLSYYRAISDLSLKV